MSGEGVTVAAGEVDLTFGAGAACEGREHDATLQGLL